MLASHPHQLRDVGNWSLLLIVTYRENLKIKRCNESMLPQVHWKSCLSKLSGLEIPSFFFFIYPHSWEKAETLAAQSCPTICDAMDYSPPGYSLWNSVGENTGVGCYSLLQGIFPTQGSNPGLLCLLHCRQILYHLSHQEAHTMLLTGMAEGGGDIPFLGYTVKKWNVLIASF